MGCRIGARGAAGVGSHIGDRRRLVIGQPCGSLHDIENAPVNRAPVFVFYVPVSRYVINLNGGENCQLL